MHHSKEAVGKRPSAVQPAVRQAHGPDQSRPFASAEAMAGQAQTDPKDKNFRQD
jgi:hypothetical protein